MKSLTFKLGLKVECTSGLSKELRANLQGCAQGNESVCELPFFLPIWRPFVIVLGASGANTYYFAP